jgi:hypothetical protein
MLTFMQFVVEANGRASYGTSPQQAAKSFSIMRHSVHDEPEVHSYIAHPHQGLHSIEGAHQHALLARRKDIPFERYGDRTPRGHFVIDHDRKTTHLHPYDFVDRSSKQELQAVHNELRKKHDVPTHWKSKTETHAGRYGLS